uniref:RGS domain-containing protein n=1 Tax=Steinernema glaseri TaxID=37863 RepID=A0A1I7Z414_9BILA
MYCDEDIEFDEALEPRDPKEFVIADLTTSLKTISFDIWRDYDKDELRTMKSLMEEGKLQEDHAAQLLFMYFFPKFHRMLAHLLSAKHHKKADIAEWYIYWKSRIPEVLLTRIDVKDQLLTALRSMHTFLLNSKKKPAPRPIPSKREVPVPTPDLRRMSIAKWIEILAAQHDIAFAPIAGKRFESHQLYRIGDEKVYFLDKVVYMYDGSAKKYSPTSPSTLINRCL